MVSAVRRQQAFFLSGAILAAAAALAWPEQAGGAARFVSESFLEVAPVIGLGLLLSAWVTASGAAAVTARSFQRRPVAMIALASAIGAVTPVCGVTVLPLMTGLLAAGVPLAPVMAFWLSSPVTDPGMFAATWAVLGPGFAIGKTVAAFGLGLLGGAGTALLSATPMVRRPLRSTRVAGRPCDAAPAGFALAIWREAPRRRVFRSELVSMARLVTTCLLLAFSAEYLLRDLLPPAVLASYVGAGSSFAIPLAVTVGAPIYLDGYAALPLVRGLLDLGMSPGAALAFLVAGSAVSIWGVLAVVPVLRPSISALFVALAVLGSLAAGYGFEWVAGSPR